MSRIHAKKGFSLSETLIAIGAIGCIIVLAIAMFNFGNFKTNTMALKENKIQSALKSATLSIIGNKDKITVTQACDPVAMRDLYLSRLMEAHAVSDINVNGKNLPALKIEGYGVLAFESSATCAVDWDNTKTSGGVVYKTPSSTSETASDASATTIADAPVVLYTNLDEKTASLNVPASVLPKKRGASSLSIGSSAGSSAGGSTGSTTGSIVTPNTMVFGVTQNGIVNTFNNVVTTPTTTTTPTGTTSTTTVTTPPANTIVNACAQGDGYSYVSATCNNREVQFYEVLNETGCKVSYCPGNGYDNNNNLVTTGMVNTLCKLGDGSGSVGQCACPAGK